MFYSEKGRGDISSRKSKTDSFRAWDTRTNGSSESPRWVTSFFYNSEPVCTNKSYEKKYPRRTSWNWSGDSQENITTFMIGRCYKRYFSWRFTENMYKDTNRNPSRSLNYFLDYVYISLWNILWWYICCDYERWPVYSTIYAHSTRAHPDRLSGSWGSR